MRYLSVWLIAFTYAPSEDKGLMYFISDLTGQECAHTGVGLALELVTKLSEVKSIYDR